jgi:hypothetical protein
MSASISGTWQEVAALAEKSSCEFVDLKFVDLPVFGSTSPSRPLTLPRNYLRMASALTLLPNNNENRPGVGQPEGQF